MLPVAAAAHPENRARRRHTIRRRLHPLGDASADKARSALLHAQNDSLARQAQGSEDDQTAIATDGIPAVRDAAERDFRSGRWHCYGSFAPLPIRSS
jgi:hypothetical protein